MGQSASSKFGYYSTAEKVAAGISMEGKNVIITGCNTGIGLETARVLAKNGANVYMACRDQNKTNAAAELIRKEAMGKVEVMELDLSSLESIRKFAGEFNGKNIPLHVLICNAGVMMCPYMKTKDGFENQIGTNHLGHFLLTNLLIQRLKEGAPSRVVVVSSLGHRFSAIKFDDLQSEKSYSSIGAYGQSKTANILFAQELNKRYSKDGIYANSLHPGTIASTELARHFYITRMPGVSYLISSVEWIGLTKTIPMGAATQVYVATAPELERVGGKYFSDSKVATPMAYATDEENAKRLWEVSAQLVGLN